MKKTIFTAIAASMAFALSAQWVEDGTNTTTTGNVGIGTTSPVEPLHVSDISGQFTLGRPGSEMNHRLTLDANTGYTNQIYFRNQPGRIFTSGNNITIGISATSDDLVIANTGKVGIGTGNPQDKLHVSGNLRLDGSQTNDEIRFESHDGFHRIAFKQLRFYDWDAGGDNMVINNGGVGIGTTAIDPAYRLSVNGVIRSKEVKVEANWSDFVFESDYALRSLEEVETYVKENKHLPEIPSEAEVTENGINLGEMDAKLLQKIEELTLYLIEQNKQLQQASQQISELQKEVAALKNN